MRVAVDDAEAAERKPPGGEHGSGEPVAHGERIVLVLEQLAAGHPIHGEQAAGGELRPDFRHADGIFAFQHVAIERDVLGLAPIVELLAQARGNLFHDLGGVERRVETLADREQPFQLPHVGFDRRLHVGILQLAGQLTAVERAGAMHLAERSGRRRMMLEAFEFAFPAGAQFRAHAALDEGPTHGRRLALQLGQFSGVFRRQRVGNGGEQLRHLHDRAFQAAERGGQPDGIGGAILRLAEQSRARHARGHAADLAADIGIALGAGRETVFFAVGGRRHDQTPASNASSSLMRLAITLNPPSQNFGSRASSPKGASSSV
jgi:hypothetical protein